MRPAVTAGRLIPGWTASTGPACALGTSRILQHTADAASAAVASSHLQTWQSTQQRWLMHQVDCRLPCISCNHGLDQRNVRNRLHQATSSHGKVSCPDDDGLPFCHGAIFVVHVNEVLCVLGHMLSSASWAPLPGDMQVVANEVVVYGVSAKFQALGPQAEQDPCESSACPSRHGLWPFALLAPAKTRLSFEHR